MHPEDGYSSRTKTTPIFFRLYFPLVVGSFFFSFSETFENGVKVKLGWSSWIPAQQRHEKSIWKGSNHGLLTTYPIPGMILQVVGHSLWLIFRGKPPFGRKSGVAWRRLLQEVSSSHNEVDWIWQHFTFSTSKLRYNQNLHFISLHRLRNPIIEKYWISEYHDIFWTETRCSC